jgi:hypothetical protein
MWIALRKQYVSRKIKIQVGIDSVGRGQAQRGAVLYGKVAFFSLGMHEEEIGLR